MAGFPPLAPVPPPAVRKTIPSNDWDAYLDAWMMLLGIRLNATDKQFEEAAAEDLSAVSFFESYYQSAAEGDLGLHHGSKAKQLRKLCFLATRRYMLHKSNSLFELFNWRTLGNICSCYPSSTALKTTLSEVWNMHHEAISSSLEKAKSIIIDGLSSQSSMIPAKIIADMRRLTVLASVLPQCGQVLMAGSDFLDTLAESYLSPKTRGELRRIIVANVYVGLVSLLKEPSINVSLLLDQLFSLKTAAGLGTSKMKSEATILSDLVCSSDMLQRLEKHLQRHPQKRGEDLLSSLRVYQIESKHLHHRYQRRKKVVDKGKGPSSGPEVPVEFHAHKMSLVSQVQDLFPDLGSAFVVRLLDVYDDNPETVVAHLLDDSLPFELQSLDRSEQLPDPAEPKHDHLAPRPTPPIYSPQLDPIPARKNVFDKDVDLAELSLSGNAKGKVRFGREDHTADEVLADRSQHATNKAAILSALAAFDSDDDERDDTYDAADVGGTVDGVTPGTDADADADARTQRANTENLDMTLFRAYKSNPSIFSRDAVTRRSQPRAQLKRETNMMDEAIEGWAVMLTRDPKRLAKLEDRMVVDAGGAGGGGSLNQPSLAPTSYRKPQDDDSDEEGESSGGPSARGRGRGRGGGGRGRGGGRGGRGGGRPPQSGEQGQSNPAANRRKEENKASRANHNRRQQRAKKIARGGGLPG